jgi:ribonuclease P protein component
VNARDTRLRKQADFALIFEQGRSVAANGLVLYWTIRSGTSGLPRAGFCVGKRLGKAVRRNRIKRLMRENWRQLVAEITVPADLVFLARNGGVQFSLAQWAAAMRFVLRKARLVNPGDDGR